MTRTLPFAAAAVVFGSLLAACGDTAHVNTDERPELRDKVHASIDDLKKTDPSIQRFFDGAYGYAVFPEIVTAGVGVGGAGGDGEVFEQGKFIGYTDLSQGSVGLQLGAQKYGEIIFFEKEAALVAFKTGTTEFDARATAVAASAGIPPPPPTTTTASPSSPSPSADSWPKPPSAAKNSASKPPPHARALTRIT